MRAAILLLCLIAFIPKAEFDRAPNVWLETLKRVYVEKHPGVTKVEVKMAETPNGLIRIEIDVPKQGV